MTYNQRSVPKNQEPELHMRWTMKRTIILLFVLMTIKNLICLNLYAQTGEREEISGKIIDSGTQLPLVGANVVVRGTKIGAASDKDGNFVISNLPPGTYTIEVSYSGYESQKRENVVVGAAKKIVMNFATQILPTQQFCRINRAAAMIFDSHLELNLNLKVDNHG